MDISKDARPMTEAERKRLYRLLFGSRKPKGESGGEAE